MALILKAPATIYDFSQHEDNIKWDEMTNPVPLAVIMRASIQVSGTRVRYADTKAVEYMAQAKAHGFKTGLYHFLSPNGIAEQAALFMSVWNKCGGAELAPIVDVEIDLDVAYKGTIGNAVWQGHIKTFLDLISAGTGRTPMIYTSQKYWAFTMTRIGLFLYPPLWTKSYPLWVAQYFNTHEITNAQTKPTAIPAGWETYAIWQYEQFGRQNGFLANDLNVASDWYAAELGAVVTPPPPPVPPTIITRVMDVDTVNGKVRLDGGAWQ